MANTIVTEADIVTSPGATGTPTARAGHFHLERAEIAALFRDC